MNQMIREMKQGCVLIFDVSLTVALKGPLFRSHLIRNDAKTDSTKNLVPISQSLIQITDQPAYGRLIVNILAKNLVDTVTDETCVKLHEECQHGNTKLFKRNRF